MKSLFQRARNGTNSAVTTRFLLVKNYGRLVIRFHALVASSSSKLPRFFWLHLEVAIKFWLMSERENYRIFFWWSPSLILFSQTAFDVCAQGRQAVENHQYLIIEKRIIFRQQQQQHHHEFEILIHSTKYIIYLTHTTRFTTVPHSANHDLPLLSSK